MAESTSTKVMLDEIMKLVDAHEQFIKDSSTLVNNIGLSIQNKLNNPSFQCGYNPDIYGQLYTKSQIIKVNINNKPITLDESFKKSPPITNEFENQCKQASTENKIYFALVDQIKKVINSPDKTITASGSCSQLIKNLIEKFLSTVDNVMNSSDLQILDFVREQKATIQQFIEKDCRSKMISCLVEKINEIDKQNLLYASTITSGPLTKASDQMESIVEELLPKLLKLNSQTFSTEIISVTQPSISGSQLEKKSILKVKDNNDDLQQNLHFLNTEVETKFTDLVMDQIDGCQMMSQTLTNENERKEMLELVNLFYLNKQNNEPGQLTTGSLNDTETGKSNTDKTKQKPIPLRKNLLTYQILSNLSRTPEPTEDGQLNNSRLVKALDAALIGLEKDIRSKLLEKINFPKRQASKPSLFENLTVNTLN